MDWVFRNGQAGSGWAGLSGTDRQALVSTGLSRTDRPVLDGPGSQGQAGLLRTRQACSKKNTRNKAAGSIPGIKR